MTSSEVEQKFVSLISDYMKEHGFDYKPTIAAAWQSEKGDWRTWAAIRNGKTNGKEVKKQRLKLGDAILLCSYIGVSIGEFCDLALYGKTKSQNVAQTQTQTQTQVQGGMGLTQTQQQSQCLQSPNETAENAELRLEIARLEGELKQCEKIVAQFLANRS